ncbi:MAG: hypothetical protein J7623_07455 [Chitinophaga sp.]|uniref:NTF2 fold immunity protein n=1 Tax=Chitinophaga sp. TaxID=1869181 RepID=UPI001B08B8C1|nr:NTF2 fold immunity protein [Chitinophaga sp.]MBO9728461.1 hypothetical protein [Chitinophaga sp.]
MACKSNNAQLSEEEKVLMIAKDTAIKVYGKRIIQGELPLVATKKNDSLWVVEGTMPDGFVGGTVYVEILRDSLKVVRMTHYK